MKHPLTLALGLALAAPMAAAQTATPAAPAPTTPAPAPAAPAATPSSATLGDIRVTGAPELLGNFLKASLSVQAGAALSGLNLRQIEQDALATGYFSSVTASLGTSGGQNVLTLAVKPNPQISAVEITGLTYFPVEDFKSRVADLLNIAPGATLNTARVDESKTLLADNFRSQGYPFTPNISTQTKAGADGSVTLTYVVDETAPITRVEVIGNTRLPKATVVDIFKPLYDAKKFTPDSYFKAAQALAQAYQAAGYLQSGVNAGGTTLDKGVLKVQVAESVVDSVDTSNLGANVSAAALQTKVGQPLQLPSLEADTRVLSNQTGKSVGFVLQPSAQNPAQVSVLFGDAQTATGPITEIRFVGNTKLTKAELEATSKLKVGDVYSRQLAESSFFALRDAYRAKGFDISTRDPISFDQGVLTYTIREAQVAKFELNWEGKHRTQDRIVLREVQNIKGVVSDTTIRDALDRITRLGIVKVTNLTTRSDDPNNPELLTYVISVSEQSSTRSIPLGVTYDTISGFQGSIGVSNNNVFGLGHTLEGSVTAQPTDSGQTLGASVTYAIPWLDIDFADFRKTRTSVALSLSSTLSPNNVILESDGTTASGRQYTQRSSGFSVRIGRSLGQYLTGSVGVGTGYNTNYLEKITTTEQATADAAGTTLPTDTQAQALIPANGQTTSISPSLNYDSTNSADFPSQGVRAGVSPSYNFGYSGTTALHWYRIEGGASTYLGFGKTLTKGFAETGKQQVFAVRANVGTLTGTYPSGSTFSLGGANTFSAYELRGVDGGTLTGQTYLSGSAEYRYDFGISNNIAQGLYGIAFVDAASAWAADGTRKSDYSVGAGVQLNLGFGGALLPALRFDYGFSPSNNSSKFSFRLGPVW